MFCKIVLVILLTSAVFECRPTEENVPVVLWHGLGDKANSTRSLGAIMRMIADELPGIYVKSLRIGNTDYEDSFNGFFLNANTQVKLACEIVRTDPKLQNGFNAIGFSQGGQFLRALIQRCPEARVKTLITLGSQHQGVYGVPKCSPHATICDVARVALSWVAYHSYVQPKIVPAQYWKDPRNIDSYLKYNTFLADINNEGPVKNRTYAKNLVKLEKFVLVRFNLDNMVTPIDTSWFGFYTPGQAREVQQLNQTTLYKEDWLGLQTLDRQGALHFLQLDSGHLRINSTWFRNVIIKKYLK